MSKSTFRRSHALAWAKLASFVLIILSCSLGPILPPVHAQVVSQSLNVTATVLPTPPTAQAVITQPGTGSRVQTTPLVLQGTCQPGLLVRVFNNGQLAGSITCSALGDFVMNITLTAGQNVLTSLNYDEFEQVGPNAPATTIFVDLPETSNPEEPVVTIDKDGSINTAPSTGPPQSGLPDNYQRLFEGTIVEPIAKALDVSAIVTPTANAVVSAALNGIFILAILGLVAILLL